MNKGQDMLKKVMGLILILGTLSCNRPPEEGFLSPDQLIAVTKELDRVISHEMSSKGFTAFSISVTDKKHVIMSKGFGFMDEAKLRPVTSETLFRVGSISKLITDIAMMQQMELGVVDLDAPIQNYLPDFSPENPFGTPITLRHLVTHQSGLVREPPSGHYFDYTTPDLASTVQSMNDTLMVAAPGTDFKYSNAFRGCNQQDVR
jgi:CubicO group peptidase (beta-lactamase class C family)